MPWRMSSSVLASPRQVPVASPLPCRAATTRISPDLAKPPRGGRTKSAPVENRCLRCDSHTNRLIPGGMEILKSSTASPTKKAKEEKRAHNILYSLDAQTIRFGPSAHIRWKAGRPLVAGAAGCPGPGRPEAEALAEATRSSPGLAVPGSVGLRCRAGHQMTTWHTRDRHWSWERRVRMGGRPPNFLLSPAVLPHLVVSWFVVMCGFV